MKYLGDTSALLRTIRRQVDPEWQIIAERGLISLCDPALVEALVTVAKKDYTELKDELRETYPPATVPDDVWDLVVEIQDELASRSEHQGLSVADLAIAATAIRLKLIVLHEDADFETVGRHMPELRQQRISVGAE